MELPAGFKEYLLRTMREEVVEELTEGLQGTPSVSIRLNPARTGNMSNGNGTEILIEGADGQVPWCKEGIYLKERPVFTADPLLHAGCYYVQEASSMFLSHVIRHLCLRPRMALDLCAAPGGKSTLLRSLLPDESLLVCNEPIRTRCQVLAENMSKWGHHNVIVTQAYPKEIGHFIGAFDCILADVPCSGEGMMRKEAEAVAQWSPALVEECAARQREIVTDIWPALKLGGTLIYSTCTFNSCEDEENVEWIARELGAEVISIPVDQGWGILGDLRPDGSLPCCHFLPGRVRGEGFFCAVLKKDGAQRNDGFIGSKNTPTTDSLKHKLCTWPTDRLDQPSDIQGKHVRVQAEIPMSELTLGDAFRYLRGESLTLPSSLPRGFVKVCYGGNRLGLVKNLGSRANNLYPKEWRIHSSRMEPHSIIQFEAQKCTASVPQTEEC